MIPKLIHYVWLGGSEMPADVKACIESWKEVMPDYEMKRWDESNIDEIDSVFMREAIAERKFAFASDVIRLHALYNYGGIYLDTDVKAFKPFDDMLSNKAFTGRESSLHIIGRKTINYVTTCCIGAERGNPFIGRCLHYYDNRYFITSRDKSLPAELRLDMKLNSEVMTRLLEEDGYKPSVLQNTKQELPDITVYPSQYFDPVGRQPESFAQHLALGTWREGDRKVWTYSWKYKIQWRLWRIVENILRKFNRIIIKLN